MATLHITEAEAQRSLPDLLTRVRNGEEVVIENDTAVPVVLSAAHPHTRLLSESLRIARERGSTATLDGNFGAQLNEVIESHQEPLDVSWD